MQSLWRDVGQCCKQVLLLIKSAVGAYGQVFSSLGNGVDIVLIIENVINSHQTDFTTKQFMLASHFHIASYTILEAYSCRFDMTPFLNDVKSMLPLDLANLI